MMGAWFPLRGTLPFTTGIARAEHCTPFRVPTVGAPRSATYGPAAHMRQAAALIARVPTRFKSEGNMDVPRELYTCVCHCDKCG